MSKITVQATIKASVEKVWQFYTEPHHIKMWNNASPDWHTPKVENDLRPGGMFLYRMEAKDGSMGFDFGGTYDSVKPYQFITYTIGDGRKVSVRFDARGKDETHVSVKFDAETENTLEMQREGWQSILNNFKHHVETH